MTKLYLIRHAEAEGNLYRIAHGQYNSILTDRGMEQVEALRRRFADEHIDAVYSSDLCRTCTTATALYVPRKLPLHKRRDLREYHMGVWEQRTWGEIERADMEQLTNFTRRLDLWRVAEAETAAQVRDRMVAAVRDIARENPGKTVAAFSHGAALRTLLGTLQGYTLEEMGQTPHGDNTAVSLLEIEGDDIRVVFRDDNSHIRENLSTFAQQKWWKRPNAIEPGLAFDPLAEEDQATYAGDCGFTPDGDKEARLASLEGEPVGVIRLDLNRDAALGLGWIETYVMLPKWRRQGYGVQLLGQAVQRYRALGRDKLRCAVASDNQEGCRFAQRYGFQAVDEQGGTVIYEKYIGYPATYTGELEA